MGAIGEDVLGKAVEFVDVPMPVAAWAANEARERDASREAVLKSGIRNLLSDLCVASCRTWPFGVIRDLSVVKLGRTCLKKYPIKRGQGCYRTRVWRNRCLHNRSFSHTFPRNNSSSNLRRSGGACSGWSR